MSKDWFKETSEHFNNFRRSPYKGWGIPAKWVIDLKAPDLRDYVRLVRENVRGQSLSNEKKVELIHKIEINLDTNHGKLLELAESKSYIEANSTDLDYFLGNIYQEEDSDRISIKDRTVSECLLAVLGDNDPHATPKFEKEEVGGIVQFARLSQFFLATSKKKEYRLLQKIKEVSKEGGTPVVIERFLIVALYAALEKERKYLAKNAELLGTAEQDTGERVKAPRWKTQRAVKYFAKAVDEGFMEQTGEDRYEWAFNNKNTTSLVYFLDKVYNPTGTTVVPYKELERVFNVRNLAQFKYVFDGTKKSQKWISSIDDLLED